MIQFSPTSLSSNSRRNLKTCQRFVDAGANYETRVARAKSHFKSKNKNTNGTFREIRATLTEMCGATCRCMYCEDSVADEVEHHRPKDLYPEQVFRWENYLFACGPCNGPKNNRFGVFDTTGNVIEVGRKLGAPVVPPTVGEPVLLDPRQEDPLSYIILDIEGGTFQFVPTAPDGTADWVRADYTIEILGLNRRDYLSRCRRNAFWHYFGCLRLFIDERDNGADQATLGNIVSAIRDSDHPTVWSEMKRQRTSIIKLRDLFDAAPEALTW